MKSSFESELEKNGYLVYPNKGTSMMPLLREHQDLMIIRPLKAPPKKNDAVLFRRDNGDYILHRITEVCDNGMYYIIGDHCISGEMVREDQILGCLTAVKRDGKVISTDDPSYQRYVKTVPLRRLALRLRYYAVKMVKKLL